MDGAGELYPAKIHFCGPSMIHGLNFVSAIGFQPSSDLVRSNDQRTGPPGDVEDVSDMIAMPMRDKNEIRSDLADINSLGERIRRYEGIEEQSFATRFDCETS